MKLQMDIFRNFQGLVSEANVSPTFPPHVVGEIELFETPEQGVLKKSF